MDSAKQTAAPGFLGEKLKEKKQKKTGKVKCGRIRDGNKSRVVGCFQWVWGGGASLITQTFCFQVFVISNI